MGTIMHYCSICGNLLELNDTYQVVAQDWETRKTKKLYETCKDINFDEADPLRRTPTIPFSE